MKLEKKYFCGIITAAVSISLVLTGATQAGPTNGNFDTLSDLTAWNPQGIVNYNTDQQNVTLDEYNSGNNISSIQQNFILESQDRYLYFDMLFNSEVVPLCDEFTASLNGTVFYFLDNTRPQSENYDDAMVTVHGLPYESQTIYLDVSSFAGQYVTLALELLGDESDDMHTTVTLDNIGVSNTIPTVVVPAPGALLLAAIGAGLAGWLRKSGKLR